MPGASSRRARCAPALEPASNEETPPRLTP